MASTKGFEKQIKRKRVWQGLYLTENSQRKGTKWFSTHNQALKSIPMKARRSKGGMAVTHSRLTYLTQEQVNELKKKKGI